MFINNYYQSALKTKNIKLQGRPINKECDFILFWSHNTAQTVTSHTKIMSVKIKQNSNYSVCLC